MKRKYYSIRSNCNSY